MIYQRCRNKKCSMDSYTRDPLSGVHSVSPVDYQHLSIAIHDSPFKYKSLFTPHSSVCPCKTTVINTYVGSLHGGDNLIRRLLRFLRNSQLAISRLPSSPPPPPAATLAVLLTALDRSLYFFLILFSIIIALETLTHGLGRWGRLPVGR